MASTPTTTVTTEATGWAWLKAHERVVMLAMVLALSAFGISKYYDVSAARADAKVATAEATLVSQEKQNALLAANSAQVLAQYQAMVTTLTAQNAALTAAISQRNKTLTQAQTVVKTAPLPDVAKTWQAAIGGENDIISSINGLVVDDAGSRRTVDMLLALPVVQANLADETKMYEGAIAAGQQAQTVITTQSNQIAGLSLQITDADKQCKAEVTAVKAEARKSKINWFKWGFITGFLTGAYVGHAL